MQPAKTVTSQLVLVAVFLLPVIWLALQAAPALSDGLPALLLQLSAAVEHPFRIRWVSDTPRSLLLFTLAYAMSIGVYVSSLRNYRRREEHGSARWGKARQINAKYRSKQPEQNKILTQHVRIGLDGRKHRRNVNVLVVGGSGAGKRAFMPSRMSCKAIPHWSFSIRRARYCGIPAACFARKGTPSRCWISSIRSFRTATMRLPI